MKPFALVPLFAAIASAAVPFAPVDTAWSRKAFVAPTGMNIDVLFRTGDTVDGLGGVKAPARKNFDYIGFVGLGATKGNDSAWLGVNTELRDSSTAFGDGGGFNVFKVARDPATGRWSRTSAPKSIDFRAVGGTWVNCGGFDTPWGTMVTAEEYPPATNTEAHNAGKQIRDTSDFVVKTQGFDDTLRRHEALGWMVEVDPATGTARKLYKMGRFSHENGALLPDRRTVILTDDATPAVLFKFVAKVAEDFTDGQLYAYKQNADGVGGSWIELPMQLDSLVVIRDVAMRRGATVGIRHEWAAYHAGKVYVNETGIDNDAGSIAKAVAKGATVEKHLKNGIWANDTAKDFYGRTLVLDTATWTMSTKVEGGTTATGKHFSNPDGLHVQVIGDKAWLVILEDLNGASQGRDPGGNNICDAWWLDLSIANPTVENLERMLVGVNSAELTGGARTPDGKTMFLTSQHPSSSNTAPYDKDLIAAFTGFDASTGIARKESNRKVRPFRQTNAVLRFEAPVSGTIQDLEGRTLIRFAKTESVKIPQGASILRTSQGTWKLLNP